MEDVNVKTCILCGRIYSLESRYLRHVRYCRRAQHQRKGRPKSCVACSASKVKCTFASPCSRCERKGLRCVYQGGGDGPQRPGAYEQQVHGDDMTVASVTWEPDDVAPRGVDQVARNIDDYGGTGEHVGTANGVRGTAWIDGSWMDFADSHGLVPDAMDLPIETPSLDENDSINLGPQLAAPPLPPLAIDMPSLETNSQHTSSPSRSSENGSVPAHLSLSLMEEQPSGQRCFQYMLTPISAPTDLTHLRQGNPVLKHAATLIMHMSCSFPQMMLRRATFPPFIHPRRHEAALPDKIAGCMAVAQLFVARTPETRGFLWRTIFAEARGFEAELATASAREVHYAMQALMIYMLMAVVDRDADTPHRGAQLVNIAGRVASRFRQLAGGEFYSMTEKEKPSVTWEDWIFAESRRRMTCLWYLLSRVIAIDVGIPCEGCPPLENLALPSSRTLWEARSQEEWLAERSAYDARHPITTMEDLSVCRASSDIEFASVAHAAAANHQSTMSAQQRLFDWEAGGDRLTVMMNIVTEFN